MKIFKEEKQNKSWSLSLNSYHDGNVVLDAVDSNSGEIIVTILIFLQGGRIVRQQEVPKVLEHCGYDSEEHNNAFDDIGRIVITGVE